MFQVKIYQPAKTAMQSGRAKTKRWKLEYEPVSGAFVEPLMGWVGQKDTLQQLNLWFDDKEQAIAYAQEQGLPYRVIEPKQKHMQIKSYADNFRFNAVRKTS